MSANPTPSRALAGDETPSPELTWQRQDGYHERSECGRYRVARVDLGDRDCYVAWRCVTTRPAEIDSVYVLKKAGDAYRLAAIRLMRQRCVEDLNRNQQP